MKSRLQSAGMLLSLLAAAAVLPGCSGGSGGSWPTASEDVLPQGVPVSADLSLGGNQQAVVLLQYQGSSVSGVLEVGAPPVPALQAQAVGVVIPPQRYAFSGTLSGQRHFEAHGSFPGSLGNFTLIGDLPTTRRGGVMTASTDVDGDGVPEVVTASPPSFPVLSKLGADANLQFTSGNGYNGLTTAITEAQGLYSTRNASSGSGLDAYLSATPAQNSPRRFLRITLANQNPTASGQTYDAGNTGQAVVVVAYVEILTRTGASPIIRRWFSTGGQLNIQSLDSQTVRLQLNNLLMQADNATGSQAAGTFTLNGTFTVHGQSGGVYVG